MSHISATALRTRRSSSWAQRLAVPLLALVAVATEPPTAQAAQQSPPPQSGPSVSSSPFVSPGDMQSGSLLLKAKEPGKMIEAPKLATDVEIDINGPIARARVTQRFKNISDGWVEGIYVFPLPENAAVDTLKMQIGERFIEGVIKPKEEARQIYEEAKREGKKASLLEQERPNIFTNSVANIGPGETVIVQIEYQESVRQDNGTFSLRLPLVVAPRYSPKPRIVETVIFDGQSGWTVTRDPVPDRERLEAPVLDPEKHPKINPVSLRVTLDAGFPLGSVTSHHHKVVKKNDGEDRVEITLADETVPADKDFELTWKASPGATPQAGLFSETTDRGDFILAYITPPQPANDNSETAQTPAREIIFVIDNSGSMGGPSMRQAKQGLLYGLGRLTPRDRFNIVRFDDSYDVLFRDTQPADPENLETAKRFVSALEADGGTEMLPALKAALADPRPGDRDHLRQVVFLTDGAIGNEQELFETIAKGRGRSRIFTVGIGSSPNSFFMSRAAEVGRGTFTHIGSAEQVAERMAELFTKLEKPVMTDLTARWSGAKAAEITPSPLPDLYAGEPIVLTAKVEELEGTLEIDGRFDNQPWTVRIPLSQAVPGIGIDKLWARRKIAALESERLLSGDWQGIDKQIEQTALDFSLVSRLTSLVAVDVTPSRPGDTPLDSTKLPLNLPDGWDFEKVFGEQFEQNLPASEPEIQEARAFIDSRAQQTLASAPQGKSIPLPATATTAELQILIGLALFGLALSLLLFGYWRSGRLHEAVSSNEVR